MLRQPTDEFDAFRRDRKKARAKRGPQASVLGYENAALRELEQVEAREVREQQLSREVHDFFAEATKQAATIVEKVSHDAEQEVDVRLQEEMHSFLVDALGRMNSLIVSTMNQPENAQLAETQIEPDLKVLVGPELDGFRYAGTPATRDAHIGQDPFAVDLQGVQAEFAEVVAAMEPCDAQDDVAETIEEHLVAEAAQGCVDPQDDAPADAGQAPGEALDALAEAEQASEEPELTVEEELEQFKSALKALVRQGVMKRDEAQAAWSARLKSCRTR